MQDYAPVELRAMFRAGHSQFWEVADKAGILSRMAIKLTYLEGTDDPRVAEDALFAGKIDLICGNHITPYKWVAKGEPIVCLASPSNAVKNRLARYDPVLDRVAGGGQADDRLAQQRGQEPGRNARAGRVPGRVQGEGFADRGHEPDRDERHRQPRSVEPH